MAILKIKLMPSLCKRNNRGWNQEEGSTTQLHNKYTWSYETIGMVSQTETVRLAFEGPQGLHGKMQQLGRTTSILCRPAKREKAALGITLVKHKPDFKSHICCQRHPIPSLGCKRTILLPLPLSVRTDELPKKNDATRGVELIICKIQECNEAAERILSDTERKRSVVEHLVGSDELVERLSELGY